MSQNQKWNAEKKIMFIVMHRAANIRIVSLRMVSEIVGISSMVVLLNHGESKTLHSTWMLK